MKNNEEKSASKSLEELFEEKKLFTVIAAVMILAQTLLSVYNFAFRKEAFHSDELWSYSYANSFPSPLFTGTPEEEYARCDQWLDGSAIRDYLTVGKDQRFRYDLMMNNISNDMHAPLYFVILHTLCSFFPGVFSKYFAFSINIIAVIAGQIFLYRLACSMCKSKFMGLAVCALWGFCSGFINMSVFLRPYSLFTMFMIMLCYYQARIYYSEGSLKSNLIKLGIVTFFGALTHHYFLVSAFAMAAFFCVYYLVKNRRTMIFYAIAMAGSVLLSIAVFPDTIKHVFLRDYANSEEIRLYGMMPLPHGIKTCFIMMLHSVTGIYTTPYLSSSYSYVLFVLVVLLLVGLPLSFLFRKEVWFKNFLKKAKETVVGLVKNADYLYLSLIFTVAFTIVVVAMTVNINSMEFFTDRYLFHVMPYLAVVLVLTVKYIFRIIKPAMKYYKPVAAVLCCAAIAYSNIHCNKRYLFGYTTPGKDIFAVSCNENSNYIMLEGDEWRSVCYTASLLGCNSLFISSTGDFDEYIDEIKKMEMNSDSYLILATYRLRDFREKEETDMGDKVVNEGMDIYYTDEYNEASKEIKGYTQDEVLKIFENDIFPGYRLQFCGSELVMGSYVYLYRFVPEDEYVYIPEEKMVTVI